MSEKTVEQLTAELTAAMQVASSIPELKKQVETLASENQALKTAREKEQSEKESLLFKSEFPDIPEDLLPSGLSLQDKKSYAAKLKAFKGTVPETTKKPDASPWAKASGASPTLDAEQAALRADEEKRRKELVGSGNAKSVADDLLKRSSDKIRAIFKLSPAK